MQYCVCVYIINAQPTIRRDCNYFNMDKIQQIAEWNEETEDWIMPKLTAGGGHALANVPSVGGGGGDDGPGPSGNLLLQICADIDICYSKYMYVYKKGLCECEHGVEVNIYIHIYIY